MPFTGNVTAAAGEQTISFRIDLENITIKMRNVSGLGDPGATTFPDAQYRYIIIPSSGLMDTNGADVYGLTYDEVVSHYNLQK